eukprot:6124150-Amphidinium_carterae.1
MLLLLHVLRLDRPNLALASPSAWGAHLVEQPTAVPLIEHGSIGMLRSTSARASDLSAKWAD